MKVCLLSRSLYPLVGGSETYVYAVAESMVELGHDVTVVTSVLPAHYAGDYDYPFKVVRVPGLSEFNSAQAPLSTLVPLYETLNMLRPDVIHVHNILLGIALTLIAKSLPGSPGVVFTDHNTPMPGDRRWISGIGCYDVELALGRFLFQHGAYDLAVAPSECFFAWALACGAPREKLKLVRHGVDIDRFSPAPASKVIRRKLCGDPNAFLMLAPGRMVRRKGITVLLEALSDQLLAGRNVHLVITTSKNTSELEFLAHVRALVSSPAVRDRATFLVDAFTPQEMPDVYRACDCVMLLSRAEGFGLVGIEALAAGVPLVATRSSGINEYLTHEVTGLAVDCDSSAGIAAAITRLMDDAGLRQSLSRRGRTLVTESFNQRVMIRSLERAYRSVLPELKRTHQVTRAAVKFNGDGSAVASHYHR
ncbi:MAG TPA: glycosyltransferase family 4 protein [Gemmatimonadaceae bacterium]|nr:glycosyltransferase family 4 protein [Gemmatimonadaceae bacterium]